MIKPAFGIDERLLADSHELFAWKNCWLRLNKNASVPWVIIVPETQEIEFHDLPPQQQLNITHLSRLIGEYFKANFGAEKINFAAIGNVVRQLHIHVIGRHSNDPLWPDVVWGRQMPARTYQNNELESIKVALQKALGLS